MTDRGYIKNSTDECIEEYNSIWGRGTELVDSDAKTGILTNREKSKRIKTAIVVIILVTIAIAGIGLATIDVMDSMISVIRF